MYTRRAGIGRNVPSFISRSTRSRFCSNSLYRYFVDPRRPPVASYGTPCGVHELRGNPTRQAMDLSVVHDDPSQFGGQSSSSDVADDRLLKSFLSEHSLARKRNGPSLSGLNKCANCLRVLSDSVSLSNGASFPHELPRRVFRRRCHPRTTVARIPPVVPSHPPLISSWTYRLALPREHLATARCFVGRSGTFIGQCCQPLYSGDPAKHLGGSSAVTEYRRKRELDRLPGLPQAPELGPPPRPKRDTSRIIFTWPLHRSRLPGNPGCVPPSTPSVLVRTSIASDGVRVKISRRATDPPG